MTFFVEGLTDKRWWWRQRCISYLAFHYSLEKSIIYRIKDILLNDPDEDVRITAAGALGSISDSPDKALFTALKADPDDLVKRTAFVSILKADIPQKIVNKERGRVNSGEIAPSLDEMRRIIGDAGMEA